jgi:hypothetical protein
MGRPSGNASDAVIAPGRAYLPRSRGKGYAHGCALPPDWPSKPTVPGLLRCGGFTGQWQSRVRPPPAPRVSTLPTIAGGPQSQCLRPEPGPDRRHSCSCAQDVGHTLPTLQRSQSSAFCFGVNQVRAVPSIRIPPYLARLEGVALPS